MPDVEVLRLPSQFDYSFHRKFSEMYTPLIEHGTCRQVVLDFSDVDYLDSAALGMMVLLQKKFSANNIQVKIKNARGATEEILRMANMRKLFEFI